MIPCQSSNKKIGCETERPAPSLIETSDLSFVLSAAVRRAVIAELRENGVERWTDVAGRQIPVRVIARHMGRGEQAREAFVRLVRRPRRLCDRGHTSGVEAFYQQTGRHN